MMAKKESCHLCGLPSDFLPYRHKAERSVSCKRCGDYYIDDLLVECGEPTDKEEKAILSGYTRWQKELSNPIPEINAQNIERIIEENKKYSDKEKVDKLLLYYSKKYPKRGAFIPFDHEMNYPITFSSGSDEFWYLILELADKSLGLIKVESKDSFRIRPEGWMRIEWLKKIELADEKYDIESGKIMKKISSIEAEVIEQTNVRGSRYSSGLARKRKNLYLSGTIQKLEKKIEIDKHIIMGIQIVSNHDEINFLFGRIQKLVEFEKNFLADRLKEIYQDCKTSQGIFDYDIAVVHKEVDGKVKEILVDLKVGELKGKKAKIPELP